VRSLLFSDIANQSPAQFLPPSSSWRPCSLCSAPLALLPPVQRVTPGRRRPPPAPRSTRRAAPPPTACSTRAGHLPSLHVGQKPRVAATPLWQARRRCLPILCPAGCSSLLPYPSSSGAVFALYSPAVLPPSAVSPLPSPGNLQHRSAATHWLLGFLLNHATPLQFRRPRVSLSSPLAPQPNPVYPRPSPSPDLPHPEPPLTGAARDRPRH
jgi:hypothetical protein